MKRKRLFWRLFPSYLLIALISLTAATWFASNAFRHFFTRQVSEDLLARVRLIEQPMRGFLIPFDADAIDTLCKTAGRSAGTRITVILPDGRVVGDSEEKSGLMDNHANRPEILAASMDGSGTAIRYSDTLKQRMMYVAISVKVNGSLRAFIRSSLRLTAIDREIRRVQIEILLAGLIFSMVAAGLSLIVSRWISRPIEEMKIGADLFAEGSLGHRLPVNETVEIGGLADALNRMAAELDARIQTIVSQRNELEAVLSSMSEGVIAVDMDEHIISMNPAAMEMFSVSTYEWTGRTLQESIRNADLQRFAESALKSGDILEGEMTLYQKSERILYVHSTPLLDAVNQKIGILVVLNDVTELRRLANMRRDFVANVSHEIKTPLTAIKGFVETLYHGGMEDAEEMRRFLGIITRHVDRLSDIIDDLLKLSRIEREDEQKAIQFSRTSLRGVIQSAVSTCQTKSEEKDIRIEVTCDETLTARIDPSLIEQAAINLLDNAIKYSDSGGGIRVCASEEANEIRIKFEDYGTGIAREHLPRLFERFYRVDKARSRTMGGTGLGLAIVKHIMQAHGGGVSVESTPGRGSTFELYLPTTGKTQN